MRYFFYDGDRIIAEREGNTWVIRHLVSLSPLLPVGFVSGGVRAYHADRLGSVRYVTDANQNILVSYIYEGFGKVITQNGGGGGPYQFCGLWGYRNDWDAGLLHVGARYYEPETGRWVQKDLLLGDVFDPQTLNQYGYCVNNPILLVDPTGCIVWKPILIGFGIGILIGVFLDELSETIYPPVTPPRTPPGVGQSLAVGLGVAQLAEAFARGAQPLPRPPWIPLPPALAAGVLLTIGVIDWVEWWTGQDIPW